MRLAAAATLTALAFLAQPAGATTMFPEKFTCPIGGETFTAQVIGSYTSWGQRPDGREFGTLPIYPIIECPTNGLLLFEGKFTAADLALLTSAIASPEYQAMRKTETPRYRVWWMMTKLGRDPYRLVWQLLQASWESDHDLERKGRYQKAYIAAATGLTRGSAQADEWFAYQMRAANALRELGYFDKAASLLDRLNQPELLPTKPEEAAGARRFIADLRQLIVEQNPSAEPANMIPSGQAPYRCEAAIPQLTAVELAVCNKPEIAEKRKKVRQWIAEEREMKAKEEAKRSSTR